LTRAGNTHDGGFAAQEEGAVRSVEHLWSREMAKERPRGPDELAGIHGVGSVRLQEYGSAFFAVIRECVHA
jgi:superfamily II DNA helicase RecQ